MSCRRGAGQGSNRELDDFSYIASHDLKEPLRGLASNARFLKEDLQDKLDESVIKRLDRMTYLCQRMERLVDDLLLLARADAGERGGAAGPGLTQVVGETLGYLVLDVLAAAQSQEPAIVEGDDAGVDG